ncbi:MAG: hypothetical protein Kow0068_08330 [Marinilabiliales bacterium]
MSTINKLQQRIKELENIEKEYYELINSNIQYRCHALFQSIPNLIFVFNKKGTIIDYKASKKEYLHIEAENIIGTTLDDLPLAAKDRRNIKSAIKNCIDKNVTREVEYSLPDNVTGKTRYFQAHFAKVNNNEAISIVTEITDKKEIDLAWRQSELKYRTLFENTNDAVLILKHDRIVDCNKRTLEMFLVDIDDFLDKSPVDFSPEYQPDGIKSSYKAQRYINKAEKGLPQIFEWVHKRCNGEEFLAEVCLNSFMLDNDTYINASLRDISERKKHELQVIRKDYELKRLNEKLTNQNNEYRALNEEYLSMNEELNSVNSNLKEALEKITESELLFRTLVESSPIGIILTDIKGKVLIVNDACTRLFGVKNKNEFSNIVFTSDNKFSNIGFIKDINTSIRKKQNINSEEQFITPWNKKIYIRYSITPIYDYYKNFTGVLINILDVSKRRKAEEELKKSQQLYRSTVNSITDFVHVIDKNFIIKLANNQLLKFNKSLNLNTDIIGKKLQKVYPHLSDKIINEYKQVFKSQKGLFTEEKIEFNGMHFYMEVKKIPIVENRKTSLVITAMRDITELKQKEIALTESERKYRLLADYHSDVVWLRDLNLYPIYVSPSVEKVYGYTREEYKYLELSDLYTEDSFNLLMLLYKTDIKKLMENELDINNYNKIIELQLIRKDKKIIWVEINFSLIKDENSNEIKIHGVTRDITLRKKAELLLRESEEKFRKIFETTLDSITIHQSNNKHFTDVNKGFEKLTLYKRNQVISKNFDIKTLWKDSSEWVKLEKMIIEKNNISNHEATLLNANNQIIYVMLSASVINIGDKPHILMVAKDITERKLTELELIKAKEKAIEADKLKTTFLANMSHEIRTPMNAIVGFANLLSKENISNEKKKLYIHQINKNSDSLLHLINEIIDLAKIESGQMSFDISLCNLMEIMEDIKHHFNAYIANTPEKNIEFSYNIIPDIEYFEFLIDPYRLRQVLNNLITNAIKYTETGYVTVTVEIKENEVLFTVRDTGIGIPADKQDIIFNRFMQIESKFSAKYGGTGLGLTIVKNIINKMGGEIWFESEPGKGSTFYFNIPLKKTQNFTRIDDRKEISFKEINWSNYTILVAEDDDMNYMFLEEMLYNTGINIIHVINGKKAIEYAKNKNIDIILMDLQMPEIDGFKATIEIKKIKPDIPIIAQTAYALDMEREKSLQVGCSDYITKPILPENLIRILNKYLK